MTEPGPTADRALARALHETITPAAVDALGKPRWKPTAKQLAFHNATEDEVLFGGSRGSGKTACAVMEAIRRTRGTIRLSVTLSRDVGDREIERPRQLPAGPIQGIEPRDCGSCTHRSSA